MVTREAIRKDVQLVEDLCSMSSKNIETKHKIKSINKKADFYSLLEESMLNEKEKRMMELFYVENMDLDFIASELGYSSQGISKMHSRILKKLESLL